MSSPAVTGTERLPKYKRVAEHLRAQIANGLLVPGAAAPSGAALSRSTGYSTLTCRRALDTLVKSGVLVAGASQGARPRVPLRESTAGERSLASAASALSAGLAARRRAAGMTQPQLAKVMDISVTSIGHAETGRLWQSRDFWELADKSVGANGELLALHDAFRAAAIWAGPLPRVAFLEDETKPETSPAIEPTAAVAVSGPVTCVAITWADGSVTTVYSPETSERSAGATPAN